MHRFVWVLALVSIACAGASSAEGSGSGPNDDDGAGGEPGGQSDTSSSRTSEGDGDLDATGRAHDETSGGEPVNPDSISSTPSEATFTHCAAPGPATCAECGLRVAITRRRGWRADAYGFEILSEGNHIRCHVTLPCDEAAPVVCESSPGAPRVFVETEGCGGPESDQSITALRFAPDACPEELRIESYRAGIRTAVQDIRPTYTATTACGGSCSGATARHVMLR